jgi:ATP-dependent DNA helicase RecG
MRMTSGELLSLIADLRAFGANPRHVEVRSEAEGPSRWLWETLSAFANTPGGGVLILGLEESGAIRPVGLSDPARARRELGALCEQMVPPVRALVELHELEGVTVLVAEIPETPLDQKPCYYSGAALTNGAFVREADGDRRLSEYEVQVMLASRGQPRDDREPIPGTGVEDFDPELLQSFFARVRVAHPAKSASSDEEILQGAGALVRHEGQWQASLAGLLALGREPQRFFPHLSIRFVSFPGTAIGDLGPKGERFLEEARIEGPIPLMISRALDVLRENMGRRGVIKGIGPETHWEYPIAAVREALVNALVHRDLSPVARGTSVQMQLFPDRLSIVNPGGLHGPVTLEGLVEVGVTTSRNATLARILEDTLVPADGLPVCENHGSGIAAVLGALRDAGMTPPHFRNGISTFGVTIPSDALFDWEALSWLAKVGADRFTDSQRAGLALVRSGMTLSGEVYRTYNNLDNGEAAKELRELVQAGVLHPQTSGRRTTYQLTYPAQEQTGRQVDVQVDQAASEVARAPLAKRILGLLRERGDLSRAELAETLTLPGTTTLYWLRNLRRVGLIEPTQPNVRSPTVRYRLTRRRHHIGLTDGQWRPIERAAQESRSGTEKGAQEGVPSARQPERHVS